MSTSSSHPEFACPDPSVHPQLSHDNDLQNSASKAALLAAESRRTAPAPDHKVDPFGPDGKLSSASAATSLKYAKPNQLPSFPSVGIEMTNSGNKAAHLAAQLKSPEAWPAPEHSNNANKAATLAAKDGGHLDLWQYKPDGTGNSAANLAMRGKSMSPQLDYGYTEDGHKRALLAATLSTKNKRVVPPMGSEPADYPDSGNAAYNALNAAKGASHMSKANEASRIQNAQGVDRSMYSYNPPVRLEVEEKAHNAELHSQAVAAAKQLYEIEKPHMDKIAAGDVNERVSRESYNEKSASGDALRMQAMNYLKVEEAARKLASERLAKLDPDGITAYRDHYGLSSGTTKSKSGNRVSRQSRGSRNLAEDSDSSDDEMQAARIRARTGRLNEATVKLDDEKRTQDRKSLMDAAQKAVQARMLAMDEQVFQSTGKMSPAMQKDWEEKARAKAAADQKERMQNHGKVHIGGGRYMDQSEIDAIAAAKLKPTLDDITTSADMQRARDAEIRSNQQRIAEEQRVEKERLADQKAHNKMVAARTKAEEHAQREQEKEQKRKAKEEEKARAAEAKAHQAEEKRQSRLQHEQEKEAERRAKEQEKRTEQERQDAAAAAERKSAAEADTKARTAHLDTTAARTSSDAVSPGATSPEATEETANVEDTVETANVEPLVAESAEPATTEATTAASATKQRQSTEVVDSPTKGRRESKLKGFFSRFTSRKEGIAVLPAEEDDTGEKFKSGTGDHGKSAELEERAEEDEAPALSEVAQGKQRAQSISDVASDDDDDEDTVRGRTSTLGTMETDDKFEEARDTFEEEPPRISTSVSASSPARGGSKFQEEL